MFSVCLIPVISMVGSFPNLRLDFLFCLPPFCAIRIMEIPARSLKRNVGIKRATKGGI